MTLSVSAEATGGNIKYQWKRGRDNVGTNSASYTFDVDSPESRYCCIVTCDGYSVTSDVVTVTRPATLEITTQPQGATAKQYDTSPVLSVEAEALGSDTALTYQWYKGSTKIGGAAASTYTIPTDTAGDFTYYCNVTCNKFTVKSDDAKVNITPLNISLKNYDGKTYDGTALANPTKDQVESSVAYNELTFEWYQGETKLDANPVNAGDYTFKITAENVTKEFPITIAKYSLTITANNQTISYGAAIGTGTD